MYMEFASQLTVVQTWLEKAETVVNEAEKLPLEEQVVPEKIDIYKVGEWINFICLKAED